MITWTDCRVCGYPVNASRGIHMECERVQQVRAVDTANRFLVSNGYRPLGKESKPFSAVWYLRSVKLAKIKLHATMEMCSNVPLDDTIMFNNYIYILSKQMIKYQFVLRRAYAAFSREAFGIKPPHWYTNGKK